MVRKLLLDGGLIGHLLTGGSNIAQGIYGYSKCLGKILDIFVWWWDLTAEQGDSTNAHWNWNNTKVYQGTMWHIMAWKTRKSTGWTTWITPIWHIWLILGRLDYRNQWFLRSKQLQDPSHTESLRFFHWHVGELDMKIGGFHQKVPSGNLT